MGDMMINYLRTMSMWADSQHTYIQIIDDKKSHFDNNQSMLSLTKGNIFGKYIVGCKIA